MTRIKRIPFMELALKFVQIRDPMNNEQKYLEFYDKNVTKIYRYIYFRVGSQEAAQDLASEAFTKTWQYLKTGNRQIGNLSALIYQICRNLISDYFRYNSDKPISLEEVSDKISDKIIGESASGNMEKAENCFQSDQIRQCLRLIRQEYQELIIWYYIDDFEITEIAQILGKTEGAVRTSLSRAIFSLRELINRGDRGKLEV